MNFTLLQHLSASLAERLNISPDELLTALNDLSAMPVHPYEQAKYQIFEKDYKFKTFQELEVPNDFNMLTAQQQLSSFTENYNKTVLSKISAYQEPGFESTYNENEIVDIDIAKKNIMKPITQSNGPQVPKLPAATNKYLKKALEESFAKYGRPDTAPYSIPAKVTLEGEQAVPRVVPRVEPITQVPITPPTPPSR